jgi:hypothetical protein
MVRTRRDHSGEDQPVAEDRIDVRIGQLWRRRRDGRAFIPAHQVADGWLDKSGVKRTAAQLHDTYLLVQATEQRTYGEQSVNGHT